MITDRKNVTVPAKNSNQQRRWARRLALQALYQWELSQQAPALIIQQYQEDRDMAKADRAYFEEILQNVPQQLAVLEGYLKRYVDRALSEVDPVELSLLRMATYELQHRLDVPYRVILNEALELEKMFGATEGYKFVNGILDKVAREIRATEISQRKKDIPPETKTQT